MLTDRWLSTHPDCKWDVNAIRREERHRKEARKQQLKKQRSQNSPPSIVKIRFNGRSSSNCRQHIFRYKFRGGVRVWRQRLMSRVLIS